MITPPKPCKRGNFRSMSFLMICFYFPMQNWFGLGRTPLSSKRISRGVGCHQKKQIYSCVLQKNVAIFLFSTCVCDFCSMVHRWTWVTIIGWKAASKCCFKHSALWRLDRSQSHHPTSKPSGKICLPASSRRFVEKLISQMVSHFIHFSDHPFSKKKRIKHPKRSRAGRTW